MEQLWWLHLQAMWRYWCYMVFIGNFNGIGHILRRCSLSCFGGLEAMNIEYTESANGNWFYIIALHRTHLLIISLRAFSKINSWLNIYFFIVTHT